MQYLSSEYPTTFFGWIIRLIKEYGLQIVYGIGRTLLLALVGTVVGLLIAIIFSLIKTKKISKRESLGKVIVFKILKGIVHGYVTVVRGTPMLVQALIIHNLLKLLGFNISPLVSGLVTVSLNTTAYLTEVLRGGIESVDDGQLEAARSIGMSNFKAMTYVVFPQAIKNAMASIGNEFIVNIKDTSVLSVIGVIELYNATSMAGNRYYKVIEAMCIAATIYLILTYTSSKILKAIEKKIGSPVKEITSSN